MAALELHDRGVLHLLERKGIGPKLKPIPDDGVHKTTLNLGQMTMMFSMFGAAIAISIIIFGIEIIWDVYFGEYFAIQF